MLERFIENLRLEADEIALVDFKDKITAHSVHLSSSHFFDKKTISSGINDVFRQGITRCYEGICHSWNRHMLI